MKKLLVVLLSLLVGSSAGFNRNHLTPEEGAEHFLKSFKKHWEFEDRDIFHEDFSGQDKFLKMTRDESIDYYFKTQIFDGWNPYTVMYLNDGTLKIKFYKDKKMSAYFIAIPNQKMEGGFMFYSFHINE